MGEETKKQGAPEVRSIVRVMEQAHFTSCGGIGLRDMGNVGERSKRSVLA